MMKHFYMIFVLGLASFGAYAMQQEYEKPQLPWVPLKYQKRIVQKHFVIPVQFSFCKPDQYYVFFVNPGTTVAQLRAMVHKELSKTMRVSEDTFFEFFINSSREYLPDENVLDNLHDQLLFCC
ncbi:MAG: hypothetical protein UU47_C0026G0004 [candidate division TM6 bacterium GW2011_GWE2_41_16]|nr:MAG: hypothetical protein UU47_C0026G0004 [candidate division TM6 bacterium GW2011_GWE2_41_16]